MDSGWTVKRIFEEICRVEEEYRLFEKKIDGIYIWKLIRYYVFLELTKKHKIIDNPHPTQKEYSNRYIWLMKHFINGTINGPLTGKGGYDTILFTHPRKVTTDDGRLIDIYSDHIEERWKKEGRNYLVIEKPYHGNFMHQASKTVRHNETLSLFTLKNYLKPKKNVVFSVNKLKHIANIPIENIEVLSNEHISRIIHGFKREYHYSIKLLSRHKPKSIYMVDAPFRNPLIAAATDLEIETIEIQHGEISPFNLAYNYPGHKKIPYFPSHMILWGKFWYNPSRMPIEEKNIIYGGYPFLDREIEKYSHIKRGGSRILFLSQGKIGKSLSKIALEFANKYKEYKVIYRLHPSEVEQWKTLYPNLYSYSMKNDNITIETKDNNPLHKSFAQSKVVVGVNSTALIESLAANCKLILIDLPGVEYFQSLVDKKLVKKVNNSEQLAKVIKEEGKQKNIDRNYFFKETGE